MPQYNTQPCITLMITDMTQRQQVNFWFVNLFIALRTIFSDYYKVKDKGIELFEKEDFSCLHISL